MQYSYGQLNCGWGCLGETVESFDEVLSLVTKYAECHEEKEVNFGFFCRDVYYSKLVIRIQCCLRGFISRKYIDRLRLIPDNLFDPTFSKARIKIMKINDECFLN